MVSLVSCRSYDPVEVRRAVGEALELLGGISRFVSPGERVLIKPNLLSPAPPDRAITTHPSVVEAVIEQIKLAGGIPLIAESPGAGLRHDEPNMRRVYSATGMADVAQRTGVELRLDPNPSYAHLPEGKLLKGAQIIPTLKEVDCLVNLPKLKTHVFMGFTGAVKNLFGVIHGVAKTAMHVRFSDELSFASMLLDVARFAGPRLTLMDGVVGLEGNGPGSGGRPREIGIIIAGNDPLEVDLIACRLVGFDIEEIPVFRAALRRGDWKGEWPEVVGLNPEEASVPDFEKPTSYPPEKRFLRFKRVNRAIEKILEQAVAPRPVPVKGRCIGCGICLQSCPQGAIEIVGGTAVIDHSICIRCYCCHEMCPRSAIKLKLSTLGRALRALGVR